MTADIYYPLSTPPFKKSVAEIKYQVKYQHKELKMIEFLLCVLIAILLTLAVNVGFNKKITGLKNLLFEPLSLLNAISLIVSLMVLFKC